MASNNHDIKDINIQKDVVSKLIETSAPSKDFYLMMVFSSIIVCLGMLLNNIIIVIGGMVVTPFLSPLLMLSLAFVVSDKLVIRRSVWIIVKSVLVIIAAGIGAVILVPRGNIDFTLIERMADINLSYLYVSLVAGAAAGYTWARPNLSSVLPGVAITVAILPPLVGIAVAFGFFDWSLLAGFLRSGLVNLTGVLLSSTFVFAVLGFYRVRGHAKNEIKKEEKELRQEK